MNRPYLILYKGKLADRKLTRKAAMAQAYLLTKEKSWDIEQVEVVEVNELESEGAKQ